MGRSGLPLNKVGETETAGVEVSGFCLGPPVSNVLLRNPEGAVIWTCKSEAQTRSGLWLKLYLR